MQKKRLDKFIRTVANWQNDLTVVLENVTDQHNIGAVLRSCDSIGIREIYVLNTDEHLQTKSIVVGKRTSGGAHKWVDVNYYIDVELCFSEIKKKYKRILGTSLGETAKDLYSLDLSQPTALVFGNEKSGLSGPVKAKLDGNFIIPQMGMAESLNISVACGVVLYEAYRQRQLKGFYEENPTVLTPEQSLLLEEYFIRHKERDRRRKTVELTVL